ncbi:MAG: MFS transporter [Microthrixaceae bacterium]|nr:MFS transporter [Microthrixaceae bacterium]
MPVRTGADQTSEIRLGTPVARWTLVATILGSGIVFLDGTIVNVALPSISKDMSADFKALQWVLNGYMVTLTALLLVGGGLGDRLGRRKVFVWGLAGFTAASVVCGIAPTPGVLIAARAAQGIGGALLVPGSLAIIGSVFHPDDRGRAIGLWSGLAGVATSIGPFVAGWLIDLASWRAAFFLNVPLAICAGWAAVKHVPDTKSPQSGGLDIAGAMTATAGLAAISYAAIDHSGIDAVVAGVVGSVLIIAFVIIQHRGKYPMMPLTLFRSAQFSGTNLATLAIYGALAVSMFLITLQLQVTLNYSALEAGAALAPFSALLLLFSARAGDLGQRLGPRIPLTVGPAISAIGLIMLASLSKGSGYLGSVLPGVVIFGAGMTLLIAPLTAAVLASVDDSRSGIASGINNAASRLAGLLAVAIIPAAAGISASDTLGEDLKAGYRGAMIISAGLMIVGSVIAFGLVRSRPATLNGA